jgi:flagellar biosynthesis protein FlhF
MHDTAHDRAPAASQHSTSRYHSMKIKRFVASDMRTAMNLVRKEHGPDAVILSNRRIEEGVEIVAAAHYDESAVQRALEASQPKPAPKQRSAAEAMIAAVTRRKPAEEQANPVAVTTSAVAALARAAVGASERTVENAPQLDVGGRFAALLKSSAPAELPEQIFAPFNQNQADAESSSVATPVTTHVPTEQPAPKINRARFVIDPPQEEVVAAPVAAHMPLPANAVTAVTTAGAFADASVKANTGAPALPSLPPSPILAPVAERVAATPRTDKELDDLRREVAGMRQVIEREMHRFTDERLRGCPVRASALDLMDEYGFDPGLARDVAAQIPSDTDASRGRGLMLGLLSQRLPIDSLDPIEAGGVIALVGPTGAGKTTTIAKLATRFVDKHGARDIALLTTDTLRVGAREQLYAIGRNLGVAVHEAHNGTNLNDLLARLADYKLVLIDTAGLGQRDRALAAQLQWLRAAGQIRTLLVLPANTAFQDMDEVVRRFGAANPQGVILSKLDETGRLGSALSIAVDHRLPIAWVTDGQDVPEDLHRASATNLVLRLEDLRRAADMPCWTPELNNAVA